MNSLDLGSNFLISTIEDDVLKVIINRPERRNAMTLEMYNGIKRAALFADSSPDVNALLITGIGDTFCVGGDMGGQYEETEGRVALEADPTDMFPFQYLERCAKLVVTVINGLCYAGGLDIVLCSDISISSDRATFRAPEIRWGIADSFLSARLPSQVGVGVAKYLMFTCAVIDANEAERIGLVGKIVPHNELESHTEWVLQQIRSTGPAARSALKRDINCHAAKFDTEIFIRSIRSGEFSEGVQSFVERRDAKWSK